MIDILFFYFVFLPFHRLLIYCWAFYLLKDFPFFTVSFCFQSLHGPSCGPASVEVFLARRGLGCGVDTSVVSCWFLLSWLSFPVWTSFYDSISSACFYCSYLSASSLLVLCVCVCVCVCAVGGVRDYCMVLLCEALCVTDCLHVKYKFT